MSDGNGKPSSETTVVLPKVTGASFAQRRADSVEGRSPAPPASLATPVNGSIVARTSTSSGDSLRSLVAVLTTGMVLGGLVGGVLGATTADGASASALVELVAVPDPGLAAADPPSQSPDMVATFVDGEFAQLSSDGFRSAVADKVASPGAPPIEVSRVGTSSVVRFSAAGTSDEAGLKVVQTAVELYTQQRTDDFRQHIETLIASIDRTLADLGAPPPESSGQARTDRLQALRSDLLLLANREQAPLRILQPPTLQSASPASPWLLGSVLGAVIGGLLAVGARTLRRSWGSTILTVADAELVTNRVLHPEIRLSRNWESTLLRGLQPRDRNAGRLLVAQIAGQRLLNGRVVAVVAASPGSASRAVAAMIAVGAAEQAPTLLVEFGPTPASGGVAVRTVNGLTVMRLPAVRSGAALDAGWTRLLETVSDGRYCVVVDAGTFPEVLRLLPVAVEPVLAMGLGVDSKPQSAAIASAIPAAPGRLLGVVTRLPWYQQWRASTRARFHV